MGAGGIACRTGDQLCATIGVQGAKFVPRRARWSAGRSGRPGAGQPSSGRPGARATGTIAAMPFDLLIRGGTRIDGASAPGRRADVGVTGDRPGRLLRHAS